MKLLFYKSPEDTTELRVVTGFADADFSPAAIRPSMEMATDELIKVIGRKTYDMIHSWYIAEPDTATSEEKELVRKTQTAVGFRSLMILAPLKDLALTNQGRLMRSDEHHKQAFEWMIDRHDQSLESIYYKSLDRLIEALDEINPIVEISPEMKWKDTEIYKNSFDVFFRTTEEFNQFFSIESRYLLMKLAPGIKKVKTEQLAAILTKEVLDEYMDKLKNGEPVPSDEVLHHMKAACAYLSLAWAIPLMSATLFPKGVMQSYVAERATSQAKKVPERSEVGVITLLFKEDGRKSLMKLEELLRPIPDPGCPDPLYEININPNQKFVST